jgi:phosphatidylglycerol lysyltransferase
MPPSPAPRAARLKRLAGIVLTLAGIGLAVFLVRGAFAGLTLGGVLRAVGATPKRAILVAALSTAASYAALSATEWYALRVVARPRREGLIWPISLASNAITNSTGFGLATGPMVRLRLYRPLGLKLPAIAEVVALASAANVLSGLASMGTCLVASLALPAAVRPWPAWVALAGGLGLIGAGLFGYQAFGLISRRVRRDDAPPPDAKTRAVALVAGMGDWLFSGLALFVLSPHALPRLPLFLLAFTAGSVLGSIVGAPAGLGVLDAFVLRFRPRGLAIHQTAAALVLYRLVYFIAPLILASAGLAVAALLGLARKPRRPR